MANAGRDPQNVRPLKLLNTLTHQEHFLEVPGEETMNEILERCLPPPLPAAAHHPKSNDRPQ
jgi:hypothetical protein